MPYLWNYVYYDNTLVSPIWEGNTPTYFQRPIIYQPIVIDDGAYKGVYFCVAHYDYQFSRLYMWKWNPDTGILTLTSVPLYSSSLHSSQFWRERALSFVSSDLQRVFLVNESYSNKAIFVDIYPVITNPPSNPLYMGQVDIFVPTNRPAVGYADGATFAVTLSSNYTNYVRIISLTNEFQSFAIPNRQVPFQHGNRLTRPLSLFSTSAGGISPNNPPIIVRSDGTLISSASGLDLPPEMSQGTISAAALSPQFCGYDFFLWDLPSNWNLDSDFQFRILDWVKDETTWIFMKKATLQGITPPPEINILSGQEGILKHLSPVNLGSLMVTQQWQTSSSSSGTIISLQEALIFVDAAAERLNLCALTPIGTASPPINAAWISPTTFHFERGVWYVTVLYLRDSSPAQSKVAFLQIAHPQFFSQYFASIPAIQTITTDDRFVTFTGKVTARYPRQHWSLAIVATRDNSLREIVASTKERVTNWETWETSADGLSWSPLPAGQPLEGQIYVRVKIPKSVIEWKKDIFVTRNPDRVWRFVFISEPSE